MLCSSTTTYSNIPFKTLFDSNPCPTLLLDNQHQILLWNQAVQNKRKLHPLLENSQNIQDLFPTLEISEFTKNSPWKTEAVLLSNKHNLFTLNFCPFENQWVVYLEDRKISKLENLLQTPFKRPHSPIVNSQSNSPGSGRREIPMQQFLKRATPTIQGSHLPAYQPNHADQTLSKDNQNNLLVGMTQLFCDTVHKIRNDFTLPSYLVDEIKAKIDLLKKSLNQNPQHLQALAETDEMIRSMKASFQKILIYLNELVEADSALEGLEGNVPQPKKNRSGARIKVDDQAQMKILIAEDNTICFKILKTMLKKLGFNEALIHQAEDGEKALKLYKVSLDTNNSFDLIFMDIHMPNMDGNESAKHIAHLKPDLPIIACSGGTGDEIHKECFSKIITKPIQKELIKESLNSIFDFSKASQEMQKK